MVGSGGTAGTGRFDQEYKNPGFWRKYIDYSSLFESQIGRTWNSVTKGRPFAYFECAVEWNSPGEEPIAPLQKPTSKRERGGNTAKSPAGAGKHVKSV